MIKLLKWGSRCGVIISCAVLCLLSALAPMAKAQCEAKPSGIVGWWKAESNAVDSVGGANGALYNGAGYAAGKVGQAFNFDGVNDRISVPDAPALHFSGSFSIEAWVAPSSYPTSPDGRGFIIFRGDNRNANDPYVVDILPDGRISFYIESDTEVATVNSANAVPVNVLSHVVATMNATSGEMRIYINGSLSASTTTTVRPLVNLDPAQNPGFGIGNSGAFPNTSFNYPFAGRIDEVSLYNRALTALEVQSLFNAGSSGKCDDPVGQCEPKPASIIAWLKAENNALDSVGANHGTLVNGATFAAGQVGQAFKLDGVDDYVSIPDNSLLRPSQITLEAWVKPTSLTPGLFQEWNTVVARGSTGNDNNPYFLGFTGGRLVFVTTHTTTATGDFLASPSSVAVGQWHHIAATFDGTTKSLFLDGALVAMKTLPSPLIYAGGSVSVLIGQDIDSGIPSSSAFDGLIDEVSIYDSAVSAAEIVNIYHAGSGGKCDDLPSLVVNNPTSTNEGNSGHTNAAFTVTLSAPSASTVTVDATLADGTATGGVDYGANLAQGKTVTQSSTIVSPGYEGLVGPERAVDGNTDGVLHADNSNSVTHTDQENQPWWQVDLGSVQSIDSIRLWNRTDSGVEDRLSNFHVFVSDVPFASNDLTDTMNDPAVQDTFVTDFPNPSTEIPVNRSGQYVRVQLSANNAYLSLAEVQVFGTQAAQVTGNITTITFAPGETSKQLTVSVIGDTDYEADETYFVNLSNPTNATIADAQGLGTITNDDAAPALNINNVTVTEGNSGTVDAVFDVTLSTAIGLPVTVDYATATSGTLPATAGSDYVAATGTVTFAPSETTKQIPIPVNGDLLYEGNERFIVNLISPTNATIADGEGFGTITDDDSKPSLVINDVAVLEGNFGTTTAIFTVTLSAPAGKAVTVKYNTAPTSTSTAIAGDDYVAVPATTLTFAPGETTKTFAITINGDTTIEGDEHYAVKLTGAANASIADSEGLGTILEDDTLLTIDNVMVTEGNSGTVDAIFMVTLSAVTSKTVTVKYATGTSSSVPATAGSDYAATNGTLTFAPGQTSKTITVKVNGDTLNEVNERFVVNLTAPTNAGIARGEAFGTITDDDTAPTLSINDVSQAEGNPAQGAPGTTAFNFTVTLSTASGKAVTLKYQTTVPSTTPAAAGVDYTAVPLTTLNFAPGETSKTVTVQVVGDAMIEGDERFVVKLSAASNATITDSEGFGTIVNDDFFGLTIDNVTVTEGNSGSADTTFTVSLSGASSKTVTVQYATGALASVPATAGTDYAEVPPTTLTFAPGETSKTITVQVNGDTLDEADERFAVNLSNPTNAVILDGEGVCSIIDDDAAPTLSIDDVKLFEGNPPSGGGATTTPFTFTLSLSAPSGQLVRVQYDTSASSPTDYTAIPPTLLLFEPGEVTKTVTVLVNCDTTVEGNEVFYLRILASPNATVTKHQGIGTILDDDGTPEVSIDNVAKAEGDAGTTDFTFTVSLSHPSTKTASVKAATTAASSFPATAGSDYIALPSTTLTFAPGETVKTVTVQVNGETANERDENFIVKLSVAVNSDILDGDGVGTILNDDALPTLSIDDVTQAEGNSGGGVPFTFTVTLSAPSGQTVTVKAATATSLTSPATAGTDYTAVPATTLTFAPGQTTKTLWVFVNGDTTVEGDEKFLVKLSAATNATIADSEGLGTITNDDAAPLLFGDADPSE